MMGGTFITPRYSYLSILGVHKCPPTKCRDLLTPFFLTFSPFVLWAPLGRPQGLGVGEWVVTGPPIVWAQVLASLRVSASISPPAARCNARHYLLGF